MTYSVLWRLPDTEAPRASIARRRERPFLANWRQYIIYIGFVCIFAIFAVTLSSQGFLNPNNLLNIVRQSAMIAVMAVAMTFVLAAGEIDLSVGSLAGFSSVVTAMTIRAAGMPAGVAAGVATGVGRRSLQWACHDPHRDPVVSGDAGDDGNFDRLVDVGEQHCGHSDHQPNVYIHFWRRQPRAQFQSCLYGRWLFGVVGHLALKKTTFGRRILATGGNEIAARYSGIDTKSIKLRVLMISSMTAAIAGMLYAGGWRPAAISLDRATSFQ